MTLIIGPRLHPVVKKMALIDLITVYETLKASLDTESARIDAADEWKRSEKWENLCALCGELRGLIALRPCRDISDAFLKIRAFAYTIDVSNDRRFIKRKIRECKGRAFEEDLALSILLDIADLKGFTPARSRARSG